MDYAFNQWEKVRRRESSSCINLLSYGVFIITVILSSCPQDWLYPYTQAHGFSSHLFSSSNIRTEVGGTTDQYLGCERKVWKKSIQNNLSMYCEGTFIWMDEHTK